MESGRTPGVTELLRKHGIKLVKSMGQSFLVDPNIPEKIVRMAGVDDSFGVLEIGPGAGALTAALCTKARRVLAIELDSRMFPILEDRLAHFSNVELMQGDVMKMDIAGLARQKMTGLDCHVCSNLPYNITTPVLTALMATSIFKTITVMVQREVARRICASPGTPEYGAFTVLADYCHSERKILFDVPPECFMPRPKVFSSVVLMRARPERLLKPEDEQALFKVVRAAFAQRRKTLVNALNAGVGDRFDKAEIADIVTKCGFGENVRGETLGVMEFIRLSEHINGANPKRGG